MKVVQVCVCVFVHMDTPYVTNLRVSIKVEGRQNDMHALYVSCLVQTGCHMLIRHRQTIILLTFISFGPGC